MKNILFILVAILTACQSSEKDYRKAIAHFSKAIELIPNYASAYFNRGISKLKSGQKNSGCLDFSKAGELGDSKAYKTIREFCN